MQDADVFSMQDAVFSAVKYLMQMRTVCNVQCAMCGVHQSPCTMECAVCMCSVQCACACVCSVQCAACSDQGAGCRCVHQLAHS